MRGGYKYRAFLTLLCASVASACATNPTYSSLRDTVRAAYNLQGFGGREGEHVRQLAALDARYRKCQAESEYYQYSDRAMVPDFVACMKSTPSIERCDIGTDSIRAAVWFLDEFADKGSVALSRAKSYGRELSAVCGKSPQPVVLTPHPKPGELERVCRAPAGLLLSMVARSRRHNHLYFGYDQVGIQRPGGPLTRNIGNPTCSGGILLEVHQKTCGGQLSGVGGLSDLKLDNFLCWMDVGG